MFIKRKCFVGFPGEITSVKVYPSSLLRWMCLAVVTLPWSLQPRFHSGINNGFDD